MNHPHRTLANGLSLAAILAAGAVLAGCHPATVKPGPSTNSTASAAATSSPAARASTRSATPPYLPVRDPCMLINDQLLAGTFGARAKDSVPAHRSSAFQLTNSVCGPTYGPLNDRTSVIVQASVYANGNGNAAMFTGMRGALDKDLVTTDIPDLGEQAYSYVDPDTGPHVAVLDGNLSLTMMADSITGPRRPDSTVIPLLREAVRQILAKTPHR